MAHIYVLDTNVIIDNPKILDSISGKIIIPFTVLEELDKHKKDRGATGANIRYFIRTFDEIAEGKNPVAGFKFGSKTLKVRAWDKACVAAMRKAGLEDTPDNRIIVTAILERAVLISNDISARIKALASGLKTQGYTTDSGADSIDEIYSGITIVEESTAFVNSIYAQKSVPYVGKNLVNNQFVLVKSKIDEKHAAITQYRDGHLCKIQERKNHGGVKPRNLEQVVLQDALFDPSLNLVSVLGPAGVGKTISCLAAALEQTIGHTSDYDKIILMKAPVPVGLDIGFLPGTAMEKIMPHFQSFFDNLEVIIPDSKDPHEYVNHLIDLGKMELTPPTYIRGRSLPKTFVICDESQNLTQEEMKTIATRMGEGSKLVVMGDVNQIDRQGLDFSNNGLTHIIESFKGQPCAAHITLTKGERSTFADLAAKLL